ncbi:MAG: M28 family peptidase [Bacilli bacterium]|nr:M28 family peptidase [Bacilli bacterium]MDD3389249.1 M28 family peptidase [Bacilli bacterium]MDD4345120.1 M28 family peptidase [Bacilli bacterium]MDY0399964.1 M28 family peptidase [Bacilli bacterium]
MDVKKLREDVFKRTDKLIKTHGPRLAGTKAALATADDLKAELETFSDWVASEDFIIHKGAFLGWIRLLVIAYIASVTLLWFKLPLYALIIAALALLILVLQFFLYLPLLDIFYPRKKARNVYGVLEPEKEVKQQIIVSGHHDSAHTFNFLIHQPKLYNLRTTGSIALVILLIVVSAYLLIYPPLTTLNLILKIVLSGGTLLVGQMWFFASKTATPGAGDNLVASALALTIGQYYKEQKSAGKGLQHTRLILMSFDAEEEGLRGARSYAKKHLKEFKETPTIGLNMDCLYDERELFFLTSDLNNFVALDVALATELATIASQHGEKVTTQKLAFLTGGTDAAELAKKGVRVTTAIGMPWSNENRSNVYHTPQDTLDNVRPAVVEQILKTYIEFIEKADQKIN